MTIAIFGVILIIFWTIWQRERAILETVKKLIKKSVHKEFDKMIEYLESDEYLEEKEERKRKKAEEEWNNS
ncbi:hypothetical protein KAS41_02325 [Candidatus Parcubacteria bacterium]|nr:hypothetical protein [Candidatus Parcubacteria bacterium]